MTDNTKKKRTTDPVFGEHGPIESQLALVTLLANVFPSVLLIAVLFYFQISLYLTGIVAMLLLLLTLLSVSTVWRRSQYQFRSLHNLLEAIVHGDYSFRGSRTASDGAFGQLIDTINALAKTLQRQRLQSEESQLLLQKVVEQIDVAIIAWDQRQAIQLINPAARKILRLNSQYSDTLLLPEYLAFANELAVGQTLVKELQLPEFKGRFRLHLESFIADGQTHQLLFLTNLSSILRLEERRAWRNLVRVLSHEINNSLVPLKSYSTTLKTQIEKRESDTYLKHELLEGLGVIGNRADSLANFVQSYQAIARLPEPERKSVDFKCCLAGLAKLFPNNPLRLDGIHITLPIDAAQIEQVMINLIKNAVEASPQGEAIAVQWQTQGTRLITDIIDNGMGIQSTDNLFTPYYTTKPTGSGIGLVFCQQVIEAHDGFLSLRNRSDAQGCIATLNLPLLLE